MKILQINASARSHGANSTRLADTITTRLIARNPDAIVERRDLAAQPHPVLDEAALGALFTPAEQRSPEQSARIALDDALIAQVQSADILVLPRHPRATQILDRRTCPLCRNVPQYKQLYAGADQRQEGLCGICARRHLS